MELTEPFRVVAGVAGEHFGDQVFCGFAIMGAYVMTVMLV